MDLLVDGATHWKKSIALSPEQTLTESIVLPANTPPTAVTLRVMDTASGRELVSFTPLPQKTESIPSPAMPAKAPGEISSNEELFLNGLHLEQDPARHLCSRAVLFGGAAPRPR